MNHIATTNRRSEWAWALYDWANSAYAVTVITAFYPLFFKQYWASDMLATESTFWMGGISSVASLIIALLAPIFGSVADTTHGQKRYLAILMMVGSLATAGLFLVGQGHWQAALALYFIGTIGWSGANVFYDAMLVSVAPPSRRHWVSSLGFGIGYLGSGLLFLFCVAMTLKPQAFGLADEAYAVRVSFLLVAIWWALFTLPLLFTVREPSNKSKRKLSGPLVGNAFKEVMKTLKEIRGQRQIWLFLLAYWFYIDGVDTIIRMAVDYGLSIGMSTDTLIGAVLVVQFVSLPGVLFFGWFASRFDAISGIWICIAGFTMTTIFAAFMSKSWHFYLLAVCIALFQGGIQSLSRSTFSLLIPAEKSGEYFGFYNMLGKTAAILGPLLVGVITLITGSHRISILSVIILFLIGMVFLYQFSKTVNKPTD